MLKRRESIYDPKTGEAKFPMVIHDFELSGDADITKFMIPYSKEYEKLECQTNFADSFGRDLARKSLKSRY